MATPLETAQATLVKAGREMGERPYLTPMLLYAAACTFLSIAIDFKKFVEIRSKETSAK